MIWCSGREDLRVEAKPLPRSLWAHARISTHLSSDAWACPPLPPIIPICPLHSPPLPSVWVLDPSILCAGISSFRNTFPSPRPCCVPLGDPTCGARHWAASGPTPPCGWWSQNVSSLQATTRSSSSPWGPPASASRKRQPAGISWVRTVLGSEAGLSPWQGGGCCLGS